MCNFGLYEEPESLTDLAAIEQQVDDVLAVFDETGYLDINELVELSELLVHTQ